MINNELFIISIKSDLSNSSYKETVLEIIQDLYNYPNRYFCLI